jgi:hypothetical protein
MGAVLESSVKSLIFINKAAALFFFFAVVVFFLFPLLRVFGARKPLFHLGFRPPNGTNLGLNGTNLGSYGDIFRA